MTYYEYIFQCEKIPTKRTLHSLVTNFFIKKELNDINYKVQQEGRLIKIFTDVFFEGDFSIDFFDKKARKFNCKLYKKNIKKTSEYKVNEEFIISGNIEYGINITGKKGKKCPIHLGRFENKDLQEKFKINIERQLGVKIESMKNIYFNRMPSEILENHIQFNNIINISLPIIVFDSEKFKRIEFTSFFQKKSYGFGNIDAI
jgi:hypothetical protein